MDKVKVLIGGGSGLIGRAISKLLLNRGYDVVILTRNKAKAQNSNNISGVSFAEWDIQKGYIDPDAVKSATVIINLAGAGVVDKPWTESYKKEILLSRTNSSATIIKAISEIPNSVETVINAAAIGYYGLDKPGKEAYVETDTPGSGFLADTCRQWEESIQPVSRLNKRLVVLRFGIVLSTEGGALKEFLKPLRFRMTTILGNGKQMVSWIHVDDLCRMILFAIEQKQTSGIYNAVAPFPVTNKELALSLAKAMYGNAFLAATVPAFVLKLVMGDRSIEVLKSTTVSSGKIEQEGFKFRFSHIADALNDLVAGE